MYLRHGSPPRGSQCKHSTLTLANGERFPCRIGIGEKGIQQAFVQAAGDKLDLLPLRWLCNRGCKFELGATPSLSTLAGRTLHFNEHHDMVYATREQIEQIMSDLPPAEALGCDGKPAPSHIHVTCSWLDVSRCAPIHRLIRLGRMGRPCVRR